MMEDEYKKRYGKLKGSREFESLNSYTQRYGGIPAYKRYDDGSSHKYSESGVLSRPCLAGESHTVHEEKLPRSARKNEGKLKKY